MLVERQKAHITLLFDALKHKVITKIALPVVHVRLGLADDHKIHHLLGRVAVLVDQRARLHVHVPPDVLDAS